jgi:hypothetical protein
MDKVMICLDCLYWHEHGSLDGLSSDRYWEVASTASGAFIYISPNDDEDGFVAFSRARCDACGSNLAGQRFPAMPFEEWKVLNAPTK